MFLAQVIFVVFVIVVYHYATAASAFFSRSNLTLFIHLVQARTRFNTPSIGSVTR